MVQLFMLLAALFCLAGSAFAADATSTAVTSGTNPSTYGNAVIFTITVTDTGGGNGSPVGTVQLRDGGVNIGSPATLAPLAATTSRATISISTLDAVAHTITAFYNSSQGGPSGWSNSTSPGITQTVNKRTLTVTATGVNRVYDGTTAATVTLTDNRISGDVLTANYTSASFTSKSVGTGKTVNVSGISISGTDAANYTLSSTSATATANITAKTVTVTFTANDKPYDGNTTATIGTKSLVGVISPDNVNLNGGSATFSDATAGVGKTVTGTGFNLTGGDASNYQLSATNPTTTASITAKSVTGNITVNSRAYDGTTTATIATRSLTGVLAGDSANVSLSGGSATFADKNVGNGKTVTAGSGFSLTGTAAGNYTLSSVGNTTANITVRAITVTAATNTKTYDGNTTATATPTVTVGSIAAGDTGNFTEAYSTAGAGVGNKTLVPSGSVTDGNGGNNSAVTFANNTTGTINTKGVTIGFTASDKDYDGTNTATIATRTVNGAVGADDVNLGTSGTATFATAAAGTAKTVTGTGFALAGTTAGNYNISNPSPTTTANIDKLGIDGAFTAASKTFDNTNSATINGRSLTGVLAADTANVTLGTSGTATFSDANAGTGKTVNGSGFAISGTASGNYQLNSTTLTTTADINKANTATALSSSANPSNFGSSVTFTANVTTAVGTITGTVTFLDGATPIGTSSVSGGSAGLTTSSLGAGPHSITAQYNGNGTPDNFNGSTSSAVNQTVNAVHFTASVSPTSTTYGSTQNYTVTVTNVDGGSNSLGSITVAIPSNMQIVGNVSVSAGSWTNPATISGSQIRANATNNGGKLDTGDSLTFTFQAKATSVGTGSAEWTTQAFASMDYTSGPFVLNGSQPTTAVNKLTVTGNFTAGSRGYNGTTAATISGRSLTGAVAGDDISLSGGTASFSDKNVGNAKLVTGIGFSLTGGAVANYQLASTTLTTNANITPAGLTVTADPQTKTFGQPDPTFTYQVSGTIYSGDALTGSLSSNSTGHAGTWQITIGSLSAGLNYSITFVPADFVINKATQTITFNQPTSPRRFGDAAFNVSATSSSGLPVTFSVVGANSSWLSGNTVTLPATGGVNDSIVLRASQVGDTDYLPAGTVDRTISVLENSKPTSSASQVQPKNINGWNKTAVSVNLNASDNAGGSGVAKIIYQIDGGAAIEASGNSASFMVSTEGVHSITFHAEDAAGNVESDQSYSFKIDTINPVPDSGTPARAPDSNGWYTAPVSINFTATDGGSGIDGAVSQLVGTLFNFESDHASIIATFKDKAENQADGTFLYKYDDVAPFIIVNGVQAGDYVTQTGPIHVNVTECYPDLAFAAGGYTVTLMKQGDATPILFSQDMVLDADGIYTMTIEARDEAGHATIMPLTFTVLHSAPTVTFDSPAAGIYNTNQLVAWHATNAVGQAVTNFVLQQLAMWIPSGDTTIIPPIFGNNYTTTDEGLHSATVRAQDQTGINEGQASVSFLVDKHAPGTTESKTGAHGLNGWFVGPDGVTFSVSGDDPLIRAASGALSEVAGSGVKQVTISATGANPTAVYTVTGNAVTLPVMMNEGTTNVHYEIADNAGNIHSGDVEIRYDHTKPVLHNVPTSFSIAATGVNGAVVNYTMPTATDNLSTPVIMVDSPTHASGQLFPVGVTTVTIQATDDAGNTICQSFTVTVFRPVPTLGSSTPASATYNAGTTTVTLDGSGFFNDSVVMFDGNPVPTTFSGFSSLTAEIPLTHASTHQITVVTPERAAMAADGGTSNSINFEIAKRSITVTPDPQTKVYGNADPGLTWQVTSGSLVGSDSISGSLTRATGENVGSYDIQQGDLTAGDNYELTFTPGVKLTITKRPVQVTANPQTKIYGDPDPALDYFVSNGSLAFGDLFLGGLSRDPGEVVGSYAITAGSLALNGNYDLTFVGNSLSITHRSVTIKAKDKTKVYGHDDPAFDHEITVGSLAFSDTFSGSLVREEGEDVGNYAINQGTVALNSNYILSFTAGNLAITPRPVEVHADHVTKVYGDTDPFLSYTITSEEGLRDGDSFTGDLHREDGEDIGDRAIDQGTLALTSNYALSFTGDTLTITKRPVKIKADAKTKTYGEADPALTYQITSGSLAVNANHDEFSGVLARDGDNHVGDKAITQGTVALSENYDLTFEGAFLTIEKLAVTVTADAKSMTYGDAEPALTYQSSVDPLPYGEHFSGNIARNAGIDVGTYAITQNTLALTNDYTLTYVGADLTITKRNVKIKADPKSKTYGDSDPPLTYQITEGSLAVNANNDAFSGALSRAPGENVNTYAINQGSVGLSTNYELAYEGADLTITKKTASVAPNAASKTYGQADPAFTGTLTGFLAADGVTATYSRTTGEDAGGSYTISATLQPAGVLGNYDITYDTAAFTINKADANIQVDGYTGTYDGNDHGASVNHATGVHGEDLSGQFTLGSRFTNAPGGTAHWSFAGGTNYNDKEGDASIVLNKADATVNVDGYSGVFDGASHGATGNAMGVHGDDLTSLLDLGSSFRNVPGGSANWSFAGNGNYNPSNGSVAITITPKSITGSFTADNKVYDGNDSATVLSRSLSGQVAPDDVSLTGGTATFSDKHVANGKTVTLAGAGLSGANAGNYALSSVDTTTANITPRAITVTADAQTKVYGNSDPTLSYNITSGSLAAGDSLSGTLSRANGENVGTHAIQQGTLTAGNDYDLSFVGADLTITARDISVKADHQSKVYGDADPTLTYVITSGSLAFSDAFSGLLSRAPGENIGDYAIGQGSLALSSNYNLSFTGDNLTITKRAITVTAGDKSKVYGTSDPALTFSVTTGTLASGDSLTGVLTRDPGETVAGGPYAIRQGTVNVTNSGNYNLTFVNGALTITKAALSITADNKSKNYLAANPALTATVVGLVPGDTLASLGITLSTNATPTSWVGSYNITVNVPAGAGANYTIAPANGTLTVKFAGNSGIMSPVDPNLPGKNYGSSVFKQKSTVPAKLKIFDASGASVSAAGTIASFVLYQTINGTIVTEPNEAVDSTTPDTAFRWDATGQQWIYNINTKSMSANVTYIFKVTLADGTFIYFGFGLK